MKRTHLLLTGFLLFCALVAAVVPALAHGDKIIPQVPDGIGADGTIWRTKFDLINLGPDPSTRITKIKLLFFKSDGTKWGVATNMGSTSEIALDLGAFQTIRIETLGNSNPLTSGYVIIRSLEGTTYFAEDYELGISVFYEVRKGSNVIDTVSVSTGQPTIAWVFPAEIDASNNLYTGMAIVNNTDFVNPITLRFWTAGTPTGGSATDGGGGIFTLKAREQRAFFLSDSLQLQPIPNVTPAVPLPSLSKFKGMVLATSYYPISTLALLQTPTPTGVQYATMVPSYADALRRNTYVYLRQEFPLDADLPVVDYFGNADDTAPWDLLYQTVTNTTRQLVPQSGAGVAPIGLRNSHEFDGDADGQNGVIANNVTLEYLQGLNYTTNSLDMSDNSTNLTLGYAFAIKTGLGRYVKARIADYITRTNADGSAYKDLALELYIYK